LNPSFCLVAFLKARLFALGGPFFFSSPWGSAAFPPGVFPPTPLFWRVGALFLLHGGKKLFSGRLVYPFPLPGGGSLHSTQCFFSCHAFQGTVFLSPSGRGPAVKKTPRGFPLLEESWGGGPYNPWFSPPWGVFLIEFSPPVGGGRQTFTPPPTRGLGLGSFPRDPLSVIFFCFTSFCFPRDLLKFSLGKSVRWKLGFPFRLLPPNFVWDGFF